MNIRQLHDELRKPGAKAFGYDGNLAFIVDKADMIWLKTSDGEKVFVCRTTDLERDDWTCERKASR